MIFFLGLSGMTTVLASKPSWQIQVQEIDDQIIELEQMKLGYTGAALRHENQAERLQFEDKAYLETRRHLELAQQNREMAARIQVEIDRLKERRISILRQNGQGDKLPPPGGDSYEDI